MPIHFPEPPYLELLSRWRVLTTTCSLPDSLTPWVINMGYRNAFLVAAFAAMAQVASTGIFIKYGRRMRKASVPKYLRYVEQGLSAH